MDRKPRTRRHIRLLAAAALGAAALVVQPGLAQAAPGDLDPAFGDGGVAHTGFNVPNDVVVEPDGRVLMTIQTFSAPPITVVALTPEGQPDPSFGQGGVARFEAPGGTTSAVRLARDSQGRILVGAGGAAGAAVLRLTGSGDLDPSFGDDGIATLPDIAIGGLAVTADDGLMIAGSADEAVFFVRLDETGALDPSFGLGGATSVDGPAPTYNYYGVSIADVAITPDGRVVAVGGTSQAGADYAEQLVVSVMDDGAPDEEFAPDEDHPGWLGLGGYGLVTGIHAAEDGSLVVAASDYARNAFTLRRLTRQGEIDRDFGVDGLAAVKIGDSEGNSWENETFARGLVTQDDGKYVVAGQAGFDDVPGDGSFALARFNSDGSIDEAFGQGGTVLTDFENQTGARAVAPAPDGRVLIAGDSAGEAIVARFVTHDGPLGDDEGDGGSGGVAGGVARQGVKVHKLLIPRTRTALARVGVRALASCAFDCKLVLEVRVKPTVASAMGLAGTLLARGTASAKGDQRRWVVAKLKRGAKRALLSYSGTGRLLVKVSAVGPGATPAAVYRSAGL